MNERRALGKGLSSLIPMGNRDNSRVYFECALEDIVPNQNQPRKLFNKDAIDDLAASIEEKGILQPVLVRRIGGGKYELIAGERRFRAASQLGMEKIPVVLKDIEEQEVFEIALIENIQRQDLNPIEEALAYKELLGKYQYTQDELAKRLGKDRSSIANTLRLLKLPEDIRSHLIEGKISMGHARALLAIENRDLQRKMVNQIMEQELTVRDVESFVQKVKDGVVPVLEVKKGSATQEVNLFENLEGDIKKFLKTRVQIKGSSHKGKIIIHFHSRDELDRLSVAILTAA